MRIDCPCKIASGAARTTPLAGRQDPATATTTTSISPPTAADTPRAGKPTSAKRALASWRCRPGQQLANHRSGPAAQFLAAEVGHRRIHQHVAGHPKPDDEGAGQPGPLYGMGGSGGDELGCDLLCELLPQS